jgi:hypothetical protein
MSWPDPLAPYVVEITRETEEDGFQRFQVIARFKVEADDYSTAEAKGKVRDNINAYPWNTAPPIT